MGDEIDTSVDETVDTEGESDTTSTDTDGDGGESDTADESSSTDEDENQDADDEEDDEPPVRKPRTNADWVKLRKERKQQRDHQGRKGGDNEDEDESDDEDDLSPEDRAAIDKHLDKRLQPILAKEQETETKSAINDFIANNPEFKPYAEKVAKWSKNESWQNIPVDRIFYAVAGKSLLKIGAARKTAADTKAKNARTAQGSNANAGGSKKDAWDMTDDEFNKEVERVTIGKN